MTCIMGWCPSPQLCQGQCFEADRQEELAYEEERARAEWEDQMAEYYAQEGAHDMVEE